MLLEQANQGAIECRAGISLALIYAFRMFGLFLILPVFAIYADDFDGATPLLIGVAIGIYGLTQAFMQIPVGILSDRIGRKPVIATALLVFALGSLVAASADSISGVILGRALQGMGAIAAALMALAADLSREEHRTRMMAGIGASIGAAFALSMVLGPLLGSWIGLQGIFTLTAVLAVVGIIVLYTLVPDPVVSVFHREAETVPSMVGETLKNSQLVRLDIGIFALHFVLMTTFLVLPLLIRDRLAFDVSEHWQIYLPVFVVSVLLMMPFVLLAEKKRRLKHVFVAAVLVLGMAEAGLLVSTDLYTTLFSLLLFFTAFNLLEALLPSLVSKTAAADGKGTAMGVYSSSQFLGAFFGGVVGGFLHQNEGIAAVFISALIVIGVWLYWAATMEHPRHLSTYLLKVGAVDVADKDRLVASLADVRGVAEALVNTDDGVAYLKVERQTLDEDTLLGYSVNRAG